MSIHEDVIPIFEDVWLKVKDELPNHLVSAGGMITEFYTTFKENAKHMDELKSWKKLYLYMTQYRATDPCEAEQIVDACPDGTFIQENREKCIAAVQSKKVAKCELRNCVSGNIQECANKALKAGVSVSVVALTCEAYRLKEVWSAIQAAKEFAHEGFNEMKKNIQDKMSEIEEKITQFAEGVTPSCFEHMDSDQRLSFHSKKSREQRRIQRLIDSAKDEIGELKVTVNNEIQSLRAHCGAANRAAIQQGLHGVSRGIELARFGADASRGMLVVSYATLFCHAAAVGANLLFKKKANDTIKILANKLDDIKKLRDALGRLQDTLDCAFEDFDEEINKPRKSQ